MGKISVLGLGSVEVGILRTYMGEFLMAGGACGQVMNALVSLNCEASIIKSRYNDRWNEFADIYWKGLGVNVINCGAVNYPMPRAVADEDKVHNRSCPSMRQKIN
jgi:hypothetical protein